MNELPNFYLIIVNDFLPSFPYIVVETKLVSDPGSFNSFRALNIVLLLTSAAFRGAWFRETNLMKQYVLFSSLDLGCFSIHSFVEFIGT